MQWVPPEDIRPKSPLVDSGVRGRAVSHSRAEGQEDRGGAVPVRARMPSAHVLGSLRQRNALPSARLWLVGTNPLVTATRGEVIENALRDHLEFTVVSDFFFTPTAELADLVLPAAHWLEQDDIVYFHKIWCVLPRRKVAQMGEARDDRAVLLDMAHRLGLNEAFPWADWQDYFRWILEPSGLSFEQFAEQGIRWARCSTASTNNRGFTRPAGALSW